jgi:predicted anti-sigma-YlaC factor YlaD
VVSAHLDGHASELELAAAERHMGACHECRRFSNRVAVMTATVRGSHPAETLYRPVLVPARPPARSRRRRRVLAQGIGVAAIVVLALLVGDVRLDQQPATHPRLGAQASLVSFDLRPLQRLHQRRNNASSLYLPAVARSPVGLPQSPSGS